MINRAARRGRIKPTMPATVEKASSRVERRGFPMPPVVREEASLSEDLPTCTAPAVVEPKMMPMTIFMRGSNPWMRLVAASAPAIGRTKVPAESRRWSTAGNLSPRSSIKVAAPKQRRAG